MDYFKALKLKKEPFSNSPDPELLYISRNHIESLQKLEMAIRLKRGLNVVLGDVGTGKTTLCRKLIQQLSLTPGKEQLELHLMLDPSFSSTYEFLSVIAGYFGLPVRVPLTQTGLVAPAELMTERQLKELIKNYLFTRGVNEGRIVVLFIDEGQMLPDACLDILRDFLNYESNEFKLLQIVIFAQKEFSVKIDELPYFANRINLCLSLLPFDFSDTCRMIAYRIRETSEDGAGLNLFTYPGMLAVYRETKGLPRSINMLCHHVLIALIIQERKKAGYFFVRSRIKKHIRVRTKQSIRANRKIFNLKQSLRTGSQILAPLEQSESMSSQISVPLEQSISANIEIPMPPKQSESISNEIPMSPKQSECISAEIPAPPKQGVDNGSKIVVLPEQNSGAGIRTLAPPEEDNTRLRALIAILFLVIALYVILSLLNDATTRLNPIQTDSHITIKLNKPVLPEADSQVIPSAPPAAVNESLELKK